MTSQTASPSVALPIKLRPTCFLNLPLELRIMVFAADPYNFYLISARHPADFLPAILLTHPKITREIYKFCTITAVVAHKRRMVAPTCSRFWFPNHDERFEEYAIEIGKKLNRHVDQADHKGIVMNSWLKCPSCCNYQVENCTTCGKNVDDTYFFLQWCWCHDGQLMKKVLKGRHCVALWEESNMRGWNDGGSAALFALCREVSQVLPSVFFFASRKSS